MKKPINVLSLFNGIGCGFVALDLANIPVNKRFSSEVDKYAIKSNDALYPDTIQIGDVRNVKGNQLGHLDIVMGGSPCQSFSFAGKRKGMSTTDNIEIHTIEHYLQLKEQNFQFEGQSYLFWEFIRVLNEAREINPNVKFLLENVMMGEKWEKILTKAIGVNPIEINSALVSAQNGRRLYWTNIGMVESGLFGDLESIITQPKDEGILLKDILEKDVDEKYFLSEQVIQRFQRYDGTSNIVGTTRPDFRTIGQRDEVYGDEGKMGCLNATDYKQPKQIIVHNTMPRSGDPTKGGTGHLSRTDGKTYCLDTGNTNAIEIKGGDFRHDEGFRWRENNKSSTSTSESTGLSGTALAKINSIIRRLTPRECFRLQTFPEFQIHTLLSTGVSDSQLYKQAGNGWTCKVPAHIFSYYKP